MYKVAKGMTISEPTTMINIANLHTNSMLENILIIIPPYFLFISSLIYTLSFKKYTYLIEHPKI